MESFENIYFNKPFSGSFRTKLKPKTVRIVENWRNYLGVTEPKNLKRYRMFVIKSVYRPTHTLRTSRGMSVQLSFLDNTPTITNLLYSKIKPGLPGKKSPKTCQN